MLERLASIVEERRKLERQLTDAKRELALRPESAAGAEGSPVREVGGTKLLARVVHGVAPKDLRGLVDEAKQQIGSGKGGGGRPDLAQAGGPHGAKADEALEAIAARLGSSSEKQRSVSAAGNAGTA